MTDNANNWDRATPASAFNGNPNHLGSSHVTYLLRDGPSNTEYRSPYAVPSQHGHDIHPGLHATGLNIDERFWPQQADPPNNTQPHGEHLQDGVNQDENAHQDYANDDPSDQDAPATAGPARRQRTAVPRSERRKNYKPKPVPSHPRLFRPFAPTETKNTMLAQWRTPQIVGSYIMFPNKRLKYNPVPPDLDQVREKLFKMEASVLLKNSQEVADYVPHITNYWRRAVQKVGVDEETGVQYEHWYCRSKRARKPAESVSRGIRNKTKNSVVMHEGKDTCKMRIRVSSFTKHADTAEDHEQWGGQACRCVAEWVHFERDCAAGDPTEHAHDQEAMDVWKHSEGIAIFAKIKCEEGNSYSAVSKWLRKEYGDVNKQAYNFGKGDVSNAAQAWRNDHKDLVLREEVPEDSEEMITMRRCVDAILEANAGSLRAALREVCKDSDALTKVVLGVLEKNKPPASAEEQRPEPWKLTEGVTLLDLPPPGASRQVQKDAGVKGPLLNPHRYDSSKHRGHPEQERGGPYPRMGEPRAPLGPDGRPIVASQVMPPRMMPSPNQTTNGPNPPLYTQQQGQFPALRPRPPFSAYGVQPPPRIEIRQVQPPAEPTQKGSLHPITVSMEVPSCPSDTCKQCRHMSRDLAGRTFFFQDRLHTPSHFTKLERLLRDPKQLLDNDYTRLLPLSQVPTVHQHPALHPRPVGGRAVGTVDVIPQARQSGLAPTSSTSQSPHIRELQRLSQSIRQALPDANVDPDPDVSPGESGESSLQPTPQPATTSIYERALPIPGKVQGSCVDDDDEDDDDTNDDDGEQQQQQPPAKRPRLESAGS